MSTCRQVGKRMRAFASLHPAPLNAFGGPHTSRLDIRKTHAVIWDAARRLRADAVGKAGGL